MESNTFLGVALIELKILSFLARQMHQRAPSKIELMMSFFFDPWPQFVAKSRTSLTKENSWGGDPTPYKKSIPIESTKWHATKRWSVDSQLDMHALQEVELVLILGWSKSHRGGNTVESSCPNEVSDL